jgi:membrane fusion protein, copper/silver efflux system
MSTGKINDPTEPKSAVPGKRRSFIVPLLFFALGALGAFGYSHWYAGRNAGDMKTASSETPGKKQPKVLYYADPMNPSNKSDKPGKAPCGMDLVPIYEEEQPGAGDLPAGTVRINPEKQQMIGVKFGEAAEIDISKTIHAVGVATHDETKVYHVHTKFAGWVDKVYVDFVGKAVKKGQPLLSVYSPDLVSTQEELLLAKKSRDILKNSAFEDIGAGSESLYRATRERLKYWDISDSQIKQIERLGTPLKTLTLYSALDGYVMARNVFPGQQVSPEMNLFDIADHSTIWIQAEVYEYEIPEVGQEQEASVTFPSFPGQIFKGRVTYVYPGMDPKTRTLKLRIALANPDHKIVPDMYANVELKLDYGKKLSIPQEAVLDSGASQMVFVAKEGGYFEPRKITAGPRVDGRQIVLAGLKAGDKVVTSANFLIDSESQLKSAAGGMGETHAGHAGAAGAESPATDHSAHQAGPAETSTGNLMLKPAETHPDNSGHAQ